MTLNTLNSIPGDKRRFVARPGDPGFTIEPAVFEALIEATSNDASRAIAQAEKAEADLFRLSTRLLTGLKGLLTQARESTIAVLSKATKDWLATDRRAVLDELDRVMATFDSQAALQLQQGQADAWMKGADLASISGVTMSSMPNIDDRVLAVATQTTPQLITNVSQATKDKIATMIRMAALGQTSPLDLMRQMGSVAGKGVWADAFARGEAIYRTEIGRMFQTANFTRMTDLQKQNPGWMKEWHAVHDSRTRPTHVIADGQRVPVDEMFTVGDYKAMYPHDPRLPARESVHCRCIAIPIRPEWAATTDVQREAAVADRIAGEVQTALNDFLAQTQRAIQQAAQPQPTVFDKFLDRIGPYRTLTGQVRSAVAEELAATLEQLDATLEELDQTIIATPDPAAVFALQAERQRAVEVREKIDAALEVLRGYRNLSLLRA